MAHRVAGGRWLAWPAALALVLLLVAGCEKQGPDLSRIAHAIAGSDSLRRLSVPPRKLVGLEDLPVASHADSDSVRWLDINQKYPRPKYRRYQPIDNGVLVDPHPGGR